MGKTLVIIGNGFDLAHGYRTSAKDFDASLDATPYKEFEENHLSKDWNDTKTPKWWFEYEKRIGEDLIDIRIADDRLKYDTDKLTWYDFLAYANQVYDALADQISSYLQLAYSRNINASKTILSSIKELLRHPKKAIVVSFNYTDTAKRYVHHVYHIHGSLAEKNIVLGFDHTNSITPYWRSDISDVDEWLIVKRNKRYQRIMTEFQRYCKKHEVLPMYYQSGLVMLERFLDNRDCSLSGEPLDVKKDDADLQLVLRFLQDTHIDLQNGLMPFIPYQKIRSIAILGHSLEADKRLLDEIISRCKYVRRIFIYSYRGESLDSWEKKAECFKRPNLFKHRKKRNRIRIIRKYY